MSKKTRERGDERGGTYETVLTPVHPIGRYLTLPLDLGCARNGDTPPRPKVGAKHYNKTKIDQPKIK